MAGKLDKKNEFTKPVEIHHDFIAGDQINITQVMNSPSFQPPANLEKQRKNYLSHLQASYRALDFKGIPQLETFSRELHLEDVYVPLLARPERPDEGETWSRQRLAGRNLNHEDLPAEMLAGLKNEAVLPVKVEETMAKYKRVVILGDPGSGKSTLLKYLALRLAVEANAPLPIIVPLNAYAAAVEKGPDCNLQRFLPDFFAARSHEMENLGPLFEIALEKGQAVVLLDGLDEVQTANRRLLIERVEYFASWAAAKGNHVAVTSRIVGYSESPLNGKNWMLYTLLDFDRQAIETFAGRWCLAFEKSTLGDTSEAAASAERERRGLLEALGANPGVGQLASNPLLLTILALIKRQGVSLPNRRVELYELYLKTLITSWSKARSLDKRPVGPEMDYLQTIAVLGPMALMLREDNPTAGLIVEERLIEWLTDFYIGEDYGLTGDEAAKRARLFLESVHRYSNLLVERGPGRYGFLHLTFEEMLAARGLVQKGQLNLENALVDIRRHVADPGWRETLLLAVGIWGVIREQPLAAAEVVRAMLKMDCEGEAVCQNILLAGACLEDVGESGIGRKAASEVQTALLAACRNRSLPPTVQRDAGFCLGRTGWVPPDLDDMVLIKAGEFLYGRNKEKRKIEQDFEVAKYPVTNRQYRLFIEAGGYENKAFWSEEGWAWCNGMYDSKAKEAFMKDRLANRPKEKRNEPFYWHDVKWNNPLAPVVGVCWFEAEAYCNWLSQKNHKTYRLPSEMEWERAAGGTDGRTYPWGEEEDKSRLNCAEFWCGEDVSKEINNWLGSTSFNHAGSTIVIQYINGTTPEGVYDLGGNIWEWMGSWFDKGQTNRVLRGGSWYSDRRLARCAFRDWLNPGSFDNVIGFRLFSPRSAAQTPKGGRL